MARIASLSSSFAFAHVALAPPEAQPGQVWQGGLRISLPTEEATPPVFCILDLVTGMGREVEVAWRAGPQMGLRIVRAYDLDQPQEGVGEALRQIRIAVLG